MRIFLFLAFFISNVYAQTVYNYNITRVIDGDTVEIDVPNLPKELSKIKLRIYGIDSPESGAKAKCEKERMMAKSATDFAKKLVKNSNNIQITIRKWDKYGGRIVGDLILDEKNYRDIMIDKKLVNPYDGKKKQAWCTGK